MTRVSTLTPQIRLGDYQFAGYTLTKTKLCPPVIATSLEMIPNCIADIKAGERASKQDRTVIASTAAFMGLYLCAIVAVLMLRWRRKTDVRRRNANIISSKQKEVEASTDIKRNDSFLSPAPVAFTNLVETPAPPPQELQSDAHHQGVVGVQSEKRLSLSVDETSRQQT